MPAKILVAEDSKRIRQIIVLNLRSGGHEVVECADGEQVMPLRRQHRPNLVILDVMMPNRTGFDIMDDLRKDPKLRAETKVLMLTAITQGTQLDDEEWRAKTGADGFLSKPFELRDLVQWVDRLLGGGV
jgi:CheY-like chemotaxis protein